MCRDDFDDTVCFGDGDDAGDAVAAQAAYEISAAGLRDRFPDFVISELLFSGESPDKMDSAENRESAE